MTNPPSDVETLREALEKAREALAAISDAYEHILVSHADFRVYARRVADDTLPAIDAALALPGGGGWRPIEVAPHGDDVLLGWYDANGQWRMELRPYSTGWSRDGVSTMSRHSWATHWMPLPFPPRAGETK